MRPERIKEQSKLHGGDSAVQRTFGSHQRMVSLRPGTRYTKEGVSVDIDSVINGEVYVRRWPKGVETQPFFSNCIRMPIAQFVEQVQDATIEEANDQAHARRDSEKDSR